MTLSPAETCRAVADIIDFDSDRFHIGNWESRDRCGTTACIAGHTALLHNDGMEKHRDWISVRSAPFGNNREDFWPGEEWIARQGQRLGLTEKAADVMFDPDSYFWKRHNADILDLRYSQVLRQLEKELEDRDSDDLIDEEELEQIAVEALRR